MIIKKQLFFGGMAVLALAIATNHILGATANNAYMNLIAKIFSSDGVISCKECVLRNADTPIIFLALLWTILYITLHKLKSNEFDLLHFQKLTREAKAIWGSFFILATSWLIFKYLNLYPELYSEDHLLENMTALFFFLASILLGIKFFHPGIYYRWWLLFVALMFFVIAMEEISWGQRIAGWSTPASLSAYNYQNETNLHNVLNPFMTPIYVIGNFIIGCFLLFIRDIRSFLLRFSWRDKFLPLLPTSAYAWTGFIFLFLSLQRFWFGDELTEQFVSFYILIYTLDIYLDVYYVQPSVQTGVKQEAPTIR